MVAVAACVPEGGIAGKLSLLLRDGVFWSYFTQGSFGRALMFRLDAVWDILGPGIKLDVFFYVMMI